MAKMEFSGRNSIFGKREISEEFVQESKSIHHLTVLVSTIESIEPIKDLTTFRNRLKID